ncbi:MAG: twin-arginine translocase TatA/TatE family subunit [Deltaproteobacteria bacterium]|jgi:Sec-independent protein translocase protein TatA|nr:twin-arginine translocase TatA/TatE family subunit [Deltaproteobacteria bacterium]
MGFGVGWLEILMVFLVTFLVIKPERWPETARFLGKAYRQFRLWWLNLTNSLEKEVEAIKKLDEPLQTVVNPINSLVKEVKDIKTEAERGQDLGQSEIKSSPGERVKEADWGRDAGLFIEREGVASQGYPPDYLADWAAKERVEASVDAKSSSDAGLVDKTLERKLD